MLVEVLATHYTHIASLAESWLAAGATSFGIWKNERLLAHWPHDRVPSQPAIAAPIYDGDLVVGDLRVTGVSGHHAGARLAAEAALVADLVRQEQELQALTASFVDSQNQLLALFETVQSIGGHATIEDTLQCLIFEIQRTIGADHVFAIILSNTVQPMLVQSAQRLAEAAIWEIFWETHIGGNAQLLAPDDTRLALLPQVRDLLLVPVYHHRKGVSGLLGVATTTSRLKARDVKLAQVIVTMASSQLENALLYQETIAQARLQAEMELARRVQVSLFPQIIPNIAGLDIYAASRPAYQVGGDFYDLITRPDRPFVFAVGDIAGKGLSAAMLMTMTRTAIHSKASFMPEPNPATVMRQSNEDLYDDFARVGMFATVLVGQYQPEQRQVIYANAGHAPVIYRPAHGKPRVLLADGPALGVLTTSVGQCQSIALGPGDLLVVATDGIIDARNRADEFFGSDRLLQLIDEHAAETAQAIAATLFDAVTTFADGRPQDDDQTVVILRGVERES
jgi:phosphoserine phosphatase RsbU/P